ncbi:MAG: tetratricopeptide repeat protein [Bacteroidales bacterium]|nr:tetratricopeptide repeat protein [Bacteroidales bacterium]MDD4216337.1 tetratricopeptide repeat protein [Bacteroidales bacterium]MDY0140505.1 tetratricopeptide repeat protein [Bacteroidales bacterium]
MYKTFALFLILSGFVFACNNSSKDNKANQALADTTETIESLTAKIRENPENAQLFVRRAYMQIENDNLSEAVNDFEIAIRVDSLMPDVYNELCDLYLLQGESGKAKDALVKCLVLFPMNGQARLKLAQIYFYVEMYKEAMHEILNLETNKLQSSESYFVKGLVLNETEAYDEAVKALRKSIEYDNENWQAYNLLGMIYYRQDDPLGVEYFISAIRLFPNNLEIRFNAGLVFQHFNLFDKALEEYDYVISADSNYYQAYFNKGYVHINGTGNYESAVKNLTAAIKIDSTAHKAWYNRGVAYEMMGKLKLAELDYRKALEVLPNYELAVNALNDVIAKQR